MSPSEGMMNDERWEDMISIGEPSIIWTWEANRPHMAVISGTLTLSCVRMTTKLIPIRFSYR